MSYDTNYNNWHGTIMVQRPSTGFRRFLDRVNYGRVRENTSLNGAPVEVRVRGTISSGEISEKSSIGLVLRDAELAGVGSKECTRYIRKFNGPHATWDFQIGRPVERTPTLAATQ